MVANAPRRGRSRSRADRSPPPPQKRAKVSAVGSGRGRREDAELARLRAQCERLEAVNAKHLQDLERSREETAAAQADFENSKTLYRELKRKHYDVQQAQKQAEHEREARALSPEQLQRVATICREETRRLVQMELADKSRLHLGQLGARPALSVARSRANRSSDCVHACAAVCASTHDSLALHPSALATTTFAVCAFERNTARIKWPRSDDSQLSTPTPHGYPTRRRWPQLSSGFCGGLLWGRSRAASLPPSARSGRRASVQLSQR